MTGRLLLDVSSLLRWTGPPVGIARVEHALASAALQRPNAVLACYDGALNQFRALHPGWRDVLLGWSGALDTHQAQPSSGLRGLLPGRQPAVAALERLRLTTGRPALAQLAGLAQRALLALRPHGFPLFDHAGARIANVPRDLGLADDLRPGPGDTVLAGTGWFDRDPAHLAALVRRDGFRFATLCYDLIPATHPRFYEPEVAHRFGEYWRGILPAAGLVIVNSACIAEDVRWFCRTNGLPAPPLAQCPLGYDPPAPRGAALALPEGLRPGRYALFVSTIEPRKGHAMLLRAWRRLLGRGVPQRAGFRLVFVGRPGWMVDDVLSALSDPALRPTVLHLTRVGEAALDALYGGAAFCLYPSAYEGFGLPIIEAFARGKAVLASTGGAAPETAGGLSPCLDPTDDAAWDAAMAAWIEDPAATSPVEARIRAGFQHPAWPDAASRILEQAVA